VDSILTILTIVHRLMLHENIFVAHRKHLFQIMANELKIPQLVVSAIYMLLQGLVSMGLFMTTHHYEYALLVILIFSGVYVGFMKRFFRLHGK